MIKGKGSVDMSIKLKHILLGLLIFSLLFVDYFLLVFGFKELFNFTLIDSLSILSSLIGFLSIISAAGVAIYVMNKNHKDADKREEKRRKDNDYIEIRKAQFRILDAVRTCHVYYATVSFDFSENNILDYKQIDTIKDIVNDMNDSLKLNKEIEMYDIDVYIKLTETTTQMLDTIAIYQRLISSKMVVKDKIILDLLEKVNKKGYEYLKENAVFNFNPGVKI